MSMKNAENDEQNDKEKYLKTKKSMSLSLSLSLSNSYKTLSPQNIQMRRHFCVYNLCCSFTLAHSCFVFRKIIEMLLYSREKANDNP